jgi:glycosyltransferase involved in cell wall biosynthesis
MKIAFDARLLDRKLNTGISRYTEFLLDYYIEQFSNDLFVITNDPNLVIANTKIIYTKYKPFNLIHFFLYRKFIADFKFDIIHIPFYSGLYKKVYGTNVILTVHDLMYCIVDDFFVGFKMLSSLKVKYYNYIVQRSLNSADIIIAISKTTCADLRKMFNVDSFVLPEYSKIQTNSDPFIMGRLNLKYKGYFLYCGNARPHKNLSMVVGLFNRLDLLPPLVLAGKGHFSSTNIINAGVVSDSELRALYEGAIAFIFPSKYEGFGLPILESLALRTPVVASRIPAFEEFESQNIFYFDVDDAAQLKCALEKVSNHTFIDEPSFFMKYEKDAIYEKLDTLYSL